MVAQPDRVTDLRYHAARWRAVPGLQHDPSGEASGRARAGRAWRRRHRGGLPGSLRGDFDCVACSGARDPGPDHLRAGALQPGRYRAGRRGAAAAAAPASTSSSPPARSTASTSSTWRRMRSSPASAGRRPGARAVRGRGVLARGCLAHRARVPGRRWWRRRSPPAPPRSTSPTRSATRCRTSSRELFRYLRKHVRGIEKVRLSVHCHDDLGMAVANSLTAVVAGARQIECTINGIGERAGNCSLEEVVMALKTRAAFFNLDDRHQHQRLYPTSPAVLGITGMPIARNKAVVGRERLRARGRHPPARHAQASLDLRDHAPRGRGPAAQRPGAGQALRPARVPRPRAGARASSSTRSSSTAPSRSSRPWPTRRRSSSTATSRRSCCARKARPGVPGPHHSHRGAQRARGARPVRLEHADGRSIERTARGDGPVDAAFKAIEAASGIAVMLRKFEVHAVSEGEDAQGEARIYVEYNQTAYRGRASAPTS